MVMGTTLGIRDLATIISTVTIINIATIMTVPKVIPAECLRDVPPTAVVVVISTMAPEAREGRVAEDVEVEGDISPEVS